MGGLVQCIENEVFASLDITTAWVGSLLTLLAGLIYLLAATLAFLPAVQGYWPSLCFGVGSIVYLLGGSLQLVLWRDNQFGLTYMSVINRPGGGSGKTAESTEAGGAAPEHSRFSSAGFVLLFLFSLASTVCCYSFNMRLGDFVSDPSGTSMHKSLAALLPAVFFQIEIALYVAMVRTPNISPLRQLCIMMRVLAFLFALDSAWTLEHLVLIHFA
jgi:hypothetical protein